jgi:hypothetical protein
VGSARTARPTSRRALRGAARDPQPVVRPPGDGQRGRGRAGPSPWSGPAIAGAVGRPGRLAFTRQKLPTLAGTKEHAARAASRAATSCARRAAASRSSS